MDVQAAILAAIADRPDDDTPRLAYADWLDDHAADLPDPDAARARAEFIRVQCEVKRLEHLPSALQQGYADLYRRQDHLLTHHRRHLLGPLADALGPHDAVFDRGFVSEIALEDHAFLAHSHAIAVLSPLPDVAVGAEAPSREFLDSPHLGLITSLRWDSLAINAEFGPLIGIPTRPVWERLRVLNIPGCEVGDAGVETLAEADTYPALTDLDVSVNEVTDEGIRTLVASPLWPRLRVLAIGGNPISDEGANLLAAAPPTGLKHLNIARTAITPHGQNRLLRRKGWKVDLF